MKTNMMRAPLIKSAAILLVFILLAYLTSASPEGSVLNSVGQIIIGAFRLVQWALAMAIGLTVCIAVLTGIFLFAVSLVNKETAASMYQAVKASVAAFCQPVCSRFGASIQCHETSACAAPPVQAAAATDEQLKEGLRAIVAGEVSKVAANQQALSDQFAALASQLQTLETKSADFAAAGQLDAITAELTASGKTLGAVQEKVATLEVKINDTVQQFQTLTPEKMLGDIPTRLQKLEQPNDEPVFDPAPLTASIENLQQEVEELKKKKSPGGAKPRKKA